MRPPESNSPPSSDAPLWIGGGLVIAVLLVFGQTLRHDFLFYDDGDYITANAMVSHGLTWEGLRWSLTAIVGNLWHPLTLMSHMLDVQLFGMRPGPHHFVNVLLHAANAVLVFTVLRRMTGALWKPALVAALFALHPLRAESVAWASERKDVLSALFFFLGLWAYARYAETRRLRDYALVAGSFALGLCAKPMLVTFPFVLLLLDFWPLRRVIVPDAKDAGRQRLRALILEKAPLFAMAVAAAGVTVWSQHTTGATGTLEAYPIGARVANAAHAYAQYLLQTFRPQGLAVMYPHPGADIAWGPASIGLLLMFGMTLAILFEWQRRPYALTGWLWFAGMLVPVSGLVQVGSMAHADRYIYLPHVGLFVAIVWSLGAEADRNSGWRPVLAFTTGLIVFALAGACYVQVRYWRNTITLFEHTVAISPNSWQARFNLGAGYAFAGRPDLGEPQFRESLRINPLAMGSKTNLAAALIELNRPAEAEALARELIEQDAYQIEYYVQLALALHRQGKDPEGLFWAGEALRIDPTYSRALDVAELCRASAVKPEIKLD